MAVECLVTMEACFREEPPCVKKIGEKMHHLKKQQQKDDTTSHSNIALARQQQQHYCQIISKTKPKTALHKASLILSFAIEERNKSSVGFYLVSSSYCTVPSFLAGLLLGIIISIEEEDEDGRTEGRKLT